MTMHGLLSVTIGVPNVTETAAYYTDFGLSPSPDGWFSTTHAARQLRIEYAPTRRLVEMRVAADDAKNALLIEASAADYRRLMRVIGTLDVMPNQVLLEATIAEITLNDQLKFGLRWTLQSRNANYTFTDDVAGAVTSVFPGFSYALKAANIAGTLNALNQITDVNVISSPSLSGMMSSPATIATFKGIRWRRATARTASAQA